MKTCTKCGKPEGEVEFGSYSRGARMQKRPSCAGCCRLASKERERQPARKAEKKAYNQEYRRANASYYRAYYSLNKVETNRRSAERNRGRRHDRYSRLRTLKEDAPCLDCGQRYAHCAMDFDHRDPRQKRAEVSFLVKTSPWERVEAEIAKCDLVCACCHRLRTYKGRNTYTTLRYRHHQAVLDELKRSLPCLDCQRSFNPCQMDFDHLQSKVANVARLVAGPSWQLEEELRKCQLVCANCHRIRGSTGERRQDLAHGEMLAALFVVTLQGTKPPKDARCVPFPLPELLGAAPDGVLARRTGISKEMVAWHRRKSGIRLSTSGKRLDALEVVT